MNTLQVMETEKMIYLVLEYASGGEIFGNHSYLVLNKTALNNCHDKLLFFPFHFVDLNDCFTHIVVTNNSSLTGSFL